MLLMLGIFYGIFLPNPIKLKIKDKKIWTKLYFRQFYIEKITGVVLWIKDPSDPKRPDPQHWS